MVFMDNAKDNTKLLKKQTIECREDNSPDIPFGIRAENSDVRNVQSLDFKTFNHNSGLISLGLMHRWGLDENAQSVSGTFYSPYRK